jgi:Acetyltransferase (GNAT) domain
MVQKVSMNIEILKPKSPRWREILANLRHDVYHLPEYAEIEAKRSHSQAEAILITQGNNVFFVPYLLRSCQDLFPQSQGSEDYFDVLSPYGYPGFLVQGDSSLSDFLPSAIQALKDALKARGACSAFFRLHPILGDRHFESFEPGTWVDNGETVSVDLDLTEAEIWAQTRRGHQSTINKCKRQELDSKVVPFHEHIDEFLEIYSETMDRVVAKEFYYFGYDYFAELLKLEDNLHLGIVTLAGQTICASLFFESCGIVQAHLGGTRTAFLKYSPFTLLLNDMRLWAKARGNTFLHLGGGVGGSKEDKLYIFKSGFSRQRHRFMTARLILDEEKYHYLVNLRAQHLGVSAAQLLETSFFPAYRQTQATLTA